MERGGRLCVRLHTYPKKKSRLAAKAKGAVCPVVCSISEQCWTCAAVEGACSVELDVLAAVGQQEEMDFVWRGGDNCCLWACCAVCELRRLAVGPWGAAVVMLRQCCSYFTANGNRGAHSLPSARHLTSTRRAFLTRLHPQHHST